MGRWPSSHVGFCAESSVQCATEASSHHSSKRRMIGRCAPDTMKAFIAGSSIQSERVQKVLRASRKTLTPRLPLAYRACSADRNAARKNAGRYCHDLTRRRVIDTNGMCFSAMAEAVISHPRSKRVCIELNRYGQPRNYDNSREPPYLMPGFGTLRPMAQGTIALGSHDAAACPGTAISLTPHHPPALPFLPPPRPPALPQSF